MEVIQTPYGRYYRTPRGEFPSVNTILSATMPPEKKQALAAWAIKSKEKWHRDHRKCKNCQHFQNEKCAIGKKGDRIQTPWKKNRCGGFEMLPLLANSYDPRTEALSRGTKIHDQIEKVLRGEPWPSAEDFPQGKQIKFFVENIKPGKLLVEEALYSAKHRYAGRVDFCGEYQGQMMVLDWTTTARTYIQKDWYADKLTQAAAYAIAIEETHQVKIDEVLVVVIGPARATLFRDPAKPWKRIWIKRLKEYHKLTEIPF